MEENRIQAVWQGEMQCTDCKIRALALFADLHERDFALIHRPITELGFDSGATLYRQADQGPVVFTLRSGLVKLEQAQSNGGQRIVRLLRQGDVAGLESLLGKPYSHTATALEPVSVCRIPKEVVSRLNQETPRLFKQLMSRWQKAVDDADNWLTELSSGPSRARVARLLFYLAEHGEHGRFSLIGREDMGSILGITKESASRAVAEFKRERYITHVGSGRYTGNLDLLENAAGR